jgi:hypothetical protein
MISIRDATRLSAAAFIGLFLFAACGKDRDSPVIGVIIPDENSVFSPGAVVRVEAEFSDNELASYVFRIGDEGGVVIPGFDYAESGSISGKWFHYQASVKVPDSAGVSVFFLHFEAKDAAGNQAALKRMLHIN